MYLSVLCVFCSIECVGQTYAVCVREPGNPTFRRTGHSALNALWSVFSQFRARTVTALRFNTCHMKSAHFSRKMWTSTVAAPVRTLGAKFPTVTECQAPSALDERRLILHSDPLQVQVEGPSLRHPLAIPTGLNLDNDVRCFGIPCPLLDTLRSLISISSCEINPVNISSF